MNMNTAVIHAPAAPLGFIEKVRVVLACAVAIVLLTTVGWFVAEPADPHSGVVLVAQPGRAMAVWPTLILLTALAGGIGAVMCPRRLVEGGVFAAAVGLTALALKGGSMQDVLDYSLVAPNEASRKGLMVRMAFDTLLWTGLMAATWIFVALVRRWVWSDEELYSPVLGAAVKPDAPAATTPKQAGWPAFVITGLVAAFIVLIAAARTPVATVARGQVIAAVGGGFFVAAMTARYGTGQHRAHWYVLAVPAVALLAWLVGYLNASMGWAVGDLRRYVDLLQTPPHALVRPLPIEYLAAGVAGALAGFWSGERVEHVTEPEKQA